MSKFYDAWKRAPRRARSGADGGAAAAGGPCPKASSALCQHPGGCGCRSGHQPRGAGALPVTRKHELLERQQAQRAPTCLAALPPWALGRPCRACLPAPARFTNPKGTRRDYWRMARAIYAAGFRPGELIHNCFLPLRAGRLDDGNRRPRAGLHRVSRRHGPDRAAGAGHGRPASRRATSARPAFSRSSWKRPPKWACPAQRDQGPVSAEAFPPSLRDWFAERGITGYQCYGTADLG
jgi:phenylacetate-CoA ligase